MKLYYHHPRQYSPALIIGVVIFVAFFVLVNPSFSQEAAPPAEEQNINPPEGVFDRDKAIAITKERGGPGGCKTEAACTAFCGSNQEECMTWSRDNGVMSGGDFDKYIGFAKSGGPGDCKTEDKCKSYCEDENHFEACLGFAEKQGIISKEDAEKSRKTGPGGCKTEKDCRTFCEEPGNQNTCLDFAVAEGIMSDSEAQKAREFQKRAEEFRNRAEEFKKRAEQEFEQPEIKEIDPGFNEEKAKQIIETKGGPGGCKTFEECEVFCENPSNQEACFKFAEENDLFNDSIAAEKIKAIIKEGGPGGCKGEKACRTFCENPDNFESCISFAEKQGLIKPEELEKAKKGIQALKNGGPAGCKTQKECETVCQNPDNQEACFSWAKSSGLISEEEAKFMEEAQKFRQEFEGRRSEFENNQRGFQGQQGRFQGQHGEFPGPSGFPGRSGEFPGKPPSGEFPPGQIPPGFERQGFEQYEGQQFGPPQGSDGQFQKPPEGFKTPEGFQTPEGFLSPEGFHHPEGFQLPTNFQPPSGTFTPPPGEFVPPPTQLAPPSTEPAPTTQPQTLIRYSPFGVILKFFLGQ